MCELREPNVRGEGALFCTTKIADYGRDENGKRRIKEGSGKDQGRIKEGSARGSRGGVRGGVLVPK